MSDNKTCPFCGEDILRVATKCKHCHEFLTPAKNTSSAASKVEHSMGGQMKQVIGCFAIIGIGILLFILITLIVS